VDKRQRIRHNLRVDALTLIHPTKLEIGQSRHSGMVLAGNPVCLVAALDPGSWPASLILALDGVKGYSI